MTRHAADLASVLFALFSASAVLVAPPAAAAYLGRPDLAALLTAPAVALAANARRGR